MENHSSNTNKKNGNMNIRKNIKERIMELENILVHNMPLVVAFSGGVDSSFLVYCAYRVLGKNMIAVTARTPFSIKRELNNAYKFAKCFGFRHEVLDVNILDKAEVVKNDYMRCYFCKKYIFSEIKAFAEKTGYSKIAEGSTQSDRADYRPGRKSLEEYGIISPLERAGFTREIVIEGYVHAGVTLDDSSSNSCLATRVAYGDMITEDVLEKIESAEQSLHDMGLGPLRVRCHGHVARIELCDAIIQQIVMDDSLRKKVILAVKRAGFSYVAIDIEGLRSGSMNEVL